MKKPTSFPWVEAIAVAFGAGVFVGAVLTPEQRAACIKAVEVLAKLPPPKK
jgi:hypothetical protein